MTVLALTPGEPAGIGPDIALQVALQGRGEATLVLVADPQVLAERARQLGLDLSLQTYAPGLRVTPGSVLVAPVAAPAAVRAGSLDPVNAGYVLATLDRAVHGTLAGEFDGMVTGPVHKGVINAAGVPFTGHTEYIAAISGGYPVMMLVAPGLRVALATTHLPLRAVADALSAELVERVLRVLDTDLRQRFGIARPRILVCGVNPHAGEDGHMGREEVDWLVPSLQRLRAAGMDLDGPRPADTAFVPEHRRRADAVLAMYHDQGLPVLKALGFGQAINVTLGLPLVRTSVDHGTALDLAGSGRAEAASLQAAVDLATQLVAGTAQ